MSVEIAERVQHAYDAGFRNGPAIEALSVIVAISLAECPRGSGSGCEHGCNPDAAGVSCGLLQVYQPAHPGTAACASDPSCVFTLGWSISSHGTSFHPWSTYTNDSFRQYLGEVRAVIASMPAPIGSGSAPPPPDPASPPSVYPPPVPSCPSGWTMDGTWCVPPPSSGGVLPLLLLVAGVGVVGYAYERRHPGALTGLLHHPSGGAPPKGGVRYGSLRPLLRR